MREREASFCLEELGMRRDKEYKEKGR